MKYVMFAALSLFSLFASAATTHNGALETGPDAKVPVVQYDYSQKLDVAKVISITSASSNECEAVKSNMVYVDSQGVRHNLQYLRLNDGCADS